MNSRVDQYFSKIPGWKKELKQLRTIILSCGLTEELKWNVPVYTFQKANIVGINGLKEYCAIAFFKGVLLKDPNHLLIRPGKNVQAGRWIKFSSVREIVAVKAILKAYIYEAIEVEKAGLKIDYKKTAAFSIPGEFQNKLDDDFTLKKAFEALTPGRQRTYLLYFSAPKQSKTRESRVEKCIPKMLNGKGLNDR